MKTLIQEEGFDLPLNGRFGDPSDCISEFHLIIGYRVNCSATGELDFRLLYRITEDGFLQVCKVGDGIPPVIIAQFRRTRVRLKSQIMFIMVEYFFDIRPLGVDYPVSYSDGEVYTRMEFEMFLDWMANKYKANVAKALVNPPSAVPMLKSYHLMPTPDGRDEKTWICNCPGCLRPTLEFSSENRKWHCRYCNRSGNENWDLWMTITFIQMKRAKELIKNAPARN